MHASIRYGLRVGRATVGGGALAAVWGVRAGPGRGGGLDLFGGRGFQFHARNGPEVFIVALMTPECLPPRDAALFDGNSISIRRALLAVDRSSTKRPDPESGPNFPIGDARIRWSCPRTRSASILRNVTIPP
jgi:hypothetical protein